MSENQKVTIKKGSLELSIDRKDLLDVNETYDGVVFNFRNGMQLNVSDLEMPNNTKILVKNASNIPSGNIVFDLTNYKNPASVKIG